MGFRLFSKKEKFHEEKPHRQIYIVPITPRMSYFVLLRHRSSEDFQFDVAVLYNESIHDDSSFLCTMFGMPLARANIPEKHLNQFVFVENKFFSFEPFNTMSLLKNTKQAQKMLGKPLCNFRNEDSPLKIYTIWKYRHSTVSTEESKKSLCYKTHTIVHDDSAPCSRFGHSFVVAPQEECGYLFGGFAELQTEDSSGEKKGKSIFYPLDDCWRLHLQSFKWEKVLDCSVPIPNVITSETKFPDYFLRCEAFYDQKTKLIVGYGERMEFQIRGKSSIQTRGTAFVIDTELKIRKIVGTLDTDFIRILPDVYVRQYASLCRVLCTPKKSPIRSFDIWSCDVNRWLKEELVRDVLENKVKTELNLFWRSDSLVKTGDLPKSESKATEDDSHQNSIDDLTWDDLIELDWSLEFSSRFRDKKFQKVNGND